MIITVWKTAAILSSSTQSVFFHFLYCNWFKAIRVGRRYVCACIVEICDRRKLVRLPVERGFQTVIVNWSLLAYHNPVLSVFIRFPHCCNFVFRSFWFRIGFVVHRTPLVLELPCSSYYCASEFVWKPRLYRHPSRTLFAATTGLSIVHVHSNCACDCR